MKRLGADGWRASVVSSLTCPSTPHNHDFVLSSEQSQAGRHALLSEICAAMAIIVPILQLLV